MTKQTFRNVVKAITPFTFFGIAVIEDPGFQAAFAGLMTVLWAAYWVTKKF